MKSSPNDEIRLELLITFASSNEAPIKMLRESKITVIYRKELRLDRFRLPKLKRGIVILITGVGRQNSVEAANLIREKLKPTMVVNIGAAGALNNQLQIGDWVIPTKIRSSSSNDSISLGEYPLALPDDLPIKYGELITFDKPILGQNKIDCKADLVDMESFYLADEIVKKSKIKFFTIKRISDYADINTESDYCSSVSIQQDQIENFILKFINNSKDPTVSVIIPTYNRATMLIRAVESVLAQSHLPDEIIVVDDGSTDDTLKQLAKYRDRISIISFNINRGVSFARNRGIEKATSNYIGLLDSDDIWDKRKLELQLKYLYRYPFYRLMQSEEIWIRKGIRVNPKLKHRKLPNFIFEESLELCLISPSSLLIEKQRLLQVGMFDVKFKACVD
ncbi:MAG: glycosyltransferase, partial [Nitrospinota bacterium]